MRKREFSARAREAFGLYDQGLADARALMSLRADELRWAVRMKWPRGVRAGSMPTTKADMVEWLMERMPAHRVSYRVRFADPVPVGAVEVKRRADAAVAAHLAGGPCADEVAGEAMRHDR